MPSTITHHVVCNHCTIEYDQTGGPTDRCGNCASRDITITAHTEIPDTWRFIDRDPLRLPDALETWVPDGWRFEPFAGSSCLIHMTEDGLLLAMTLSDGADPPAGPDVESCVGVYDGWDSFNLVQPMLLFFGKAGELARSRVRRG